MVNPKMVRFQIIMKIGIVLGFNLQHRNEFLIKNESTERMYGTKKLYQIMLGHLEGKKYHHRNVPSSGLKKRR